MKQWSEIGGRSQRQSILGGILDPTDASSNMPDDAAAASDFESGTRGTSSIRFGTSFLDARHVVLPVKLLFISLFPSCRAS